MCDVVHSDFGDCICRELSPCEPLLLDSGSPIIYHNYWAEGLSPDGNH